MQFEVYKGLKGGEYVVTTRDLMFHERATITSDWEKRERITETLEKGSVGTVQPQQVLSLDGRVWIKVYMRYEIEGTVYPVRYTDIELYEPTDV
jgi:hypothetical protein